MSLTAAFIRQALLHLLLKLSDSIQRLESLLLIASADQTAGATSQTSVDFSALGIRDMNGLASTMSDDKDDRYVLLSRHL